MAHRLLPSALALLAALSLAACQRGNPPRGAILVVIDTLRADHLGAYGYDRPVSPRIDALAADATRFENAISPAPWTLPSLATLMTSLYPTVHGAVRSSDVWELSWLTDPQGFDAVTRLEPSRTTLAEILKRAGFATAGFVQGAYPSRVFGVAQGFDVYADNATPGMRFDIEDALAWLDRERPERFFLYLHTVEVHSPYAPIELNPFFAARWPKERRAYFARAVEEERARFAALDFGSSAGSLVDGSLESIQALKGLAPNAPAKDVEQLVALYDRGVAYTDHWIGHLLDQLRARGLLDASVLVVTSDHGEEFLEHGFLEHGRTFYDEMLRVPLIVRVPGEGQGRVVTQQVGLVDVLPTLLDVLGVETPRAVQGRSLRPLLRGESLAARAQFGEAGMEPRERAVRTDGWKYVRRPGGREELYDLRADPGETDDRCARAPETCRELRGKLRTFLRESAALRRATRLPTAREAPVDDATRERLRSLGYAE